MSKFLFTVTELIEAGSFTKIEYENALKTTAEAKTKPWLVYQKIARYKGVISSSFFEKTDTYFNGKTETQ